MKQMKLKRLNYQSPFERKLIDKLTMILLYVAVGLLLITVLVIKSGVK